MEDLEATTSSLDETEMAFDDLLDRKRACVLSGTNGDESMKARLMDIQESQSLISKKKHLLKSVIENGKVLHNRLDKMYKKLDQAEGWATVDAVGGVVVSTMVKRQAADEAKAIGRTIPENVKALQESIQQLNDFQKDPAVENLSMGQLQSGLERVGGGPVISVMDYMDSFFAEWSVLSGIQSSKRHCSEARRKVNEICEKVNMELKSTLQVKEQLKKEEREMVYTYDMTK